MSVKGISTPKELERMFEDYVASVKDTTVNVIHPKYGVTELKNSAPLTLEGFSVWARKERGASLFGYIYNLEGKYNEFQEVVKYIRSYIFSHNFNGAACGKYKESLIIRQLSLRESTENKNENYNHEIKAEFGSQALPPAQESTNNT